jgi:hypothetical protein
MAAGELQLGQAQQIPDMIDAAVSTFVSLAFVLGEEGRQFELLEMMLQEKLRLFDIRVHAAAPCKRAA